MPPAGDLAFVTQSDSIANAMLEWTASQRIGFSRIVSLGESTEVEIGDILDYLALDLATRAVLVHLEGIADARRFLSAGRAVARVKPVLVLKAGRQIGPRPEASGNVGIRLHRDQVYDAAFARAGLVRVGSIEELFAAASSLGAGAVRRGHGLRNGRLGLAHQRPRPGRAGGRRVARRRGHRRAPRAGALRADRGRPRAPWRPSPARWIWAPTPTARATPPP